MKPSLTLVLALCGGLVALPALGADTTGNAKPYTPEYKAAFVEGCVEGGMNKPACECFIRLLEPQWTEAQLADFGAKVTTDPAMEPPPLVTSIIRTCMANPDAAAIAP